MIYSDGVTRVPTGCATEIFTAVWKNQKLRVQKVLNQKGLVSQLLCALILEPFVAFKKEIEGLPWWSSG